MAKKWGGLAHWGATNYRNLTGDDQRTREFACSQDVGSYLDQARSVEMTANQPFNDCFDQAIARFESQSAILQCDIPPMIATCENHKRNFKNSLAMVDEIDPHNWLDSKEIECAQCGQKLHWLRHSPMYDETFFYCTQCPMRVEVSHYDDRARKLRKMVESEVGESRTQQFVKLYLGLIEQNLTPCDCGGTFTHDAPRRCLRCFTVLPQSEPGRDVYPPESSDGTFSSGYESLSEPSRPLIKTENIWKAEV